MRRRSLPPAEIEGVAPSAARLQARPAESTADSVEDIPDSEDALEQSAHNSMAPPNAQIEDVGEVLAASVANLAIDAGMLQSANHTTARADLAINEAIDQLTEQLAAFCLEHLERTVDPSFRDPNNHVDVNRDEEAFENKLSVSISIIG